MRWISKPVDPRKVHSLVLALRDSELKVEPAVLPVLADLLVRRGIEEPALAACFLAPSLDQLHDPFQMLGMQAAVDRLEAAIERKEKILIYGDYDVDGTTAIVILKTAIEIAGGEAGFHVPHRIREGYDLREDVIERAAAEGVHLIISVDMGIRAFSAAEAARLAGVDLIVTDHHLPGQDGIPRALVVVNPNQAGCGYPCKYLCGAGVAFKLAQGLLQRRLAGKDQSRLLMSFMKVVAIATIADAVPLLGENRVFAKLGLEGLHRPVNAGLRALLEVAKLGDGRTLSATEVAFRIAPRLNAAGRMDVARDVVELFSVKDDEKARQIAGRLDELNAGRQDEERRILESVEQRLAEEPGLRNAYCMVVDGEAWHRGVIGITATRIVERYTRPAVIVSREGEEAFGSGRSIATFHLLDALESCRHLFTRFGGHAHAAGFALPSSHIAELREHLDRYARTRLTPADFDPQLEYERELPLHEVTPELQQALSLLEPFGMENPEPVFIAKAVRLMGPAQAVKDKHVRLRLAPAGNGMGTGDGSAQAGGAGGRSTWRDNITYKAMGWSLKELCDGLQLLAGDRLDIAYTLGMNDHPEFGGLELILRDLRKSAAGVSRT
jgi:single-stranded-DNA-specific exonuclease